VTVKAAIATPLILLASLLVGCGLERTSGNTTETENMLTAVEFRLDSLLSSWNRYGDGPTVATLRLDSTKVDFRHTDSLGRDLSLERADGLKLPFQVVFWDRQAQRGRLRFRVDPAMLGADARIRLRWRQPLRYWDDSAIVWKALPDSQVLALNSVLVDDFEHGVLRSRLPDSASWYAIALDSATVTSPGLVSAAKGRSGTALHLGYSTGSGKFSLLGIALAKRPRSLRSLDSIVLWTRGTGTLRIAFDHLIDSGSGGGKAWAARDLDSTWTRIRLRPRDLDSADGVGGNIGWDAVQDSVTNLTLLLTGGKDLWLDDVRLYGIDRDDLK